MSQKFPLIEECKLVNKLLRNLIALNNHSYSVAFKISYTDLKFTIFCKLQRPKYTFQGD